MNKEHTPLLPCPFCGHAATYYQAWEPDPANENLPREEHKLRPEYERNFVSCDNFWPCNAQIGWFKTKKEAIAAWNKRA